MNKIYRKSKLHYADVENSIAQFVSCTQHPMSQSLKFRNFRKSETTHFKEERVGENA